MTVIEIGDVKAEPGELKHGKLQLERLPDWGETFVPLTVLNGTSEGPVLWVGATIHGSEVPGIEVIRRLTREVLDPKELRGAIIGAAPLNPYGFRHREHTVPMDGGNINSKFPGDPEGTISERVAHVLNTQALPKCDLALDFHSSTMFGTEFMCVATCDHPEVMRRTLEMAEAFGFAAVRVTRDMWQYDKALISWAMDMGKPAILPEPLRQGGWSEVSLRASVRGVLNVMRWAGMIDGEIEVQDEIKLAGGYYVGQGVRAHSSGILEVLVEAGDWVDEGQLLGVLRDPWGNDLDHYISPARAAVRSMPTHRVVYAGQSVATLFVPGTKEEIWGAWL